MGQTAQGYALKLIQKRLRSVWEVEQALQRRGVEPEEIHAVISGLTEAGLLDDERVACAWVNDRDRFSPRGVFLLRGELIKKGIAKETIDKVLRDRTDRTEDPVDELAQAQAVAASKARLYANLSRETRRRRLGGFLLRRGFSQDTVRRILDA